MAFARPGCRKNERSALLSCQFVEQGLGLFQIDGVEVLDETPFEGGHRNGAARTCLQSHPCHEHYRHSAAVSGDASIAKTTKTARIATLASSDLLPKKRFDTAKTQSGHYRVEDRLLAAIGPGAQSSPGRSRHIPFCELPCRNRNLTS
jgi:hypothetical protein